MFREIVNPFLVAKDKVPIFHLIFADDLLIFGRVDESTSFKLREILQTFCKLSAQKINEEQSRLAFSPNTPMEYRTLLQDHLNVKESENLRIYLGLPPLS